ncbi:hypothetical protein BDY21DRAFT_372401 [Lineolata rhizophorae]|uniref:Ubiquitin-like domain-containing protein n=1 Tax=Lineolata rhizophorae TaxID=578093 RepID=A0A6A6NYZ6_9PEZI|nr:hypothetical protein BDY21DRAFT_372401 [Lineolata rhizophorae]
MAARYIYENSATTFDVVGDGSFITSLNILTNKHIIGPQSPLLNDSFIFETAHGTRWVLRYDRFRQNMDLLSEVIERFFHEDSNFIGGRIPSYLLLLMDHDWIKPSIVLDKSTWTDHVRPGCMVAMSMEARVQRMFLADPGHCLRPTIPCFSSVPYRIHDPGLGAFVFWRAFHNVINNWVKESDNIPISLYHFVSRLFEVVRAIFLHNEVLWFYFNHLENANSLSQDNERYKRVHVWGDMITSLGHVPGSPRPSSSVGQTQSGAEASEESQRRHGALAQQLLVYQPEQPGWRRRRPVESLACWTSFQQPDVSRGEHVVRQMVRPVTDADRIRIAAESAWARGMLMPNLGPGVVNMEEGLVDACRWLAELFWGSEEENGKRIKQTTKWFLPPIIPDEPRF